MLEPRPFSGEIYVHTNVLNGKSYVGQTTAGVAKRWSLHQRCARSPRTPAYGNLFSKAIRKYGAGAFEHQTLSIARSQTELDNLEKVWIILLQAKAPAGYNLANGGYAAAGHAVSLEVRARLSLKQKANWENLGYRQRYSVSRTGKKHAFRNRRHQSLETIANRVAKNTGKKRTLEQVQNLIAGQAYRRVV